MKRKHCQKSRMNGRFCKILRESSKKRENIFVGVSSCAKGQKVVFCSGSAEKSSKKVVEIFGSLVKSPYFCTRFRERKPRGASSKRELHKRRRQEDKIQRLLFALINVRGEKFKKSQLLKNRFQ